MARHDRNDFFDPRPAPGRDEYVCRFDAELRRRLCARRERNIHDVAAAETVRLLSAFEKIAAQYAIPEVYARVRITAARAEHYRADNKQRAAGTHFHRDGEGRVLRGRDVFSGDAPAGEDGLSAFDVVEDAQTDVEGTVVAEQHVEWMLDIARREAGEVDAASLEGYVYFGLTDAEQAERRGTARETENRRKHRAARAVHGRLSADNVE